MRLTVAAGLDGFSPSLLALFPGADPPRRLVHSQLKAVFCTVEHGAPGIPSAGWTSAPFSQLPVLGDLGATQRLQHEAFPLGLLELRCPTGPGHAASVSLILGHPGGVLWSFPGVLMGTSRTTNTCIFLRCGGGNAGLGPGV